MFIYRQETKTFEWKKELFKEPMTIDAIADFMGVPPNSPILAPAGTQVLYIPTHLVHDANNKAAEPGFIHHWKTIDDLPVASCRYFYHDPIQNLRTVANGELTDPWLIFPASFTSREAIDSLMTDIYKQSTL